MKLSKLHLAAFGPFTDRLLDFGSVDHSVVFVHGPNEAGKSSTLRAISDLRYGFHPQSKDNFIHEHRDLKLGGVFLDRAGREYCVARRKGRAGTFTYDDGNPVPPEIEALITCGLKKEEYEGMFGLDHRRLRSGGEALLAGEGEVGAALFEASAGVRSIPGILERLDQNARTYFMPGARGRNGRINEALRDYTEQNAQYKAALVKPAVWADLSRGHQAAQAALFELEQRRRNLHGELYRVTELRAVAPLIRALDAATETLIALKDTPLLPETAVAERARAEAGLAEAKSNAQAAAKEAARLRAGLDAMVLDTAVLALDSAIERLAASADALQTYRGNLAEASADVLAQERAMQQLARQIDPGADPQAVLSKAPAATAKAAIGALLRSLELAQQRLEQHRESSFVASAGEDGSAPASLPLPEARAALRSVQNEVTRSETMLARMHVLPQQINAARRQIDSLLTDLGLSRAEELHRIRPLLVGEIDAAKTMAEANETERTGLRRRMKQIDDALSMEARQREEWLAGGAVPTFDEVLAARARRDAGWSLVRAQFVDGLSPDLGGYTGGRPFLQVFEEDVRHADELADLLARDTKRAAQLQACARKIAELTRDRTLLQEDLAAIDAREAGQARQWSQRLTERNLPALRPAELREWQEVLVKARACGEVLQNSLEELAVVKQARARLASALAAALVNAGASLQPEENNLDALCAVAAQLEEEFKLREKAWNTAAGKRAEREAQQRQLRQREAQLKDDCAHADAAARQAFQDLGLPHGTGVAAARARIVEFEALQAAKAALDGALLAQARARESIAAIERQALALAKEVGDPAPDDARLYAGRLMARLRQAKETETASKLARQDLAREVNSQRGHEDTAARHENTLSALCRAACVAWPAHLPEAEEQSRRKREAQATVDRVHRDLAAASQRPADDLRSLLTDYDLAHMEAEEVRLKEELGSADARLGASRQAEEAARRALEAVDSADTAVAARQRMERASASVCASIGPWMRSRLAHALLDEAMKRFRDRAQGPMLQAASGYFQRMTDGQFVRLVSDEGSDGRPTLVAQRANGAHLRVEGMSEGTRDQLYLALRLAALELRRNAGYDLPVVLDDVLMTSDDGRAGLVLDALTEFSRGHQVILFTHHRHLLDVAERCVPGSMLAVVGL